MLPRSAARGAPGLGVLLSVGTGVLLSVGLGVGLGVLLLLGIGVGVPVAVAVALGVGVAAARPNWLPHLLPFRKWPVYQSNPSILTVGPE